MRPVHPGREYRDALAKAMADIAILLTYLATTCAPACRRQVNLETAVRQKLVKNAAKYSVEKAKGVATVYDRL